MFNNGQDVEERHATKNRLQPPMHSLHNTLGLRVGGGHHDMLDAQGVTEGGPGRRSELGALVQGESVRDPETRDPFDKGVDASGCGGILDVVGGGPMS